MISSTVPDPNGFRAFMAIKVGKFDFLQVFST